MRKADRLFQLTNLIRARQPITAEEMALELEVSVRTIYRYIDDLSASGVPIYGTAGVGYQLHEKFELPPLNLTEGELDALVLGVKMVSSWTSDTLSESASSLERKVGAVIPGRLADKYKRTVYAPDILSKERDRHNWELMHRSTKNSNSVFIEYNSLNEKRTSRVIFPLGLFYWGGKWTIGSWCTLREDYRDFRLDRVIAARIADKDSLKGEDINLESYFASVIKSRI